MEPFHQQSVADLGQGLRRGDFKGVDLTRHFLERIRLLNPGLHAIITVNPHALDEAAQRDQEPSRGPLHGIPVLIKDNIDVQGMPCTAGSIALKDHHPGQDAFLVQKLREAGCVVLGKTNMTEWANFMTIEMPNGYSSLGGQTVNSRVKGQDTGGSSSGSGVAVAAGLAPFAIGTETSGSIIHPAAHSGIVGLKPTVGRISRSGIIPISYSQDTAGPMAHTVDAAALLFEAMLGTDPRDPSMTGQPEFQQASIQLRGKRLGVMRESFQHLTPEEQGLLEAALEKLWEAGITLLDVNYPHPALSHQWRWEVLTHEFKEGLNRYLSGVTHGPKNLSELIDFYDEHPEEGLRYGQILLLAANSTTGTLSNPAYNRSRKLDLTYSRELGIDYLLSEHKLDALVMPKWFGYDVPARAGYPVLTVPVDFREDGMAVNLTFSSTAFTEQLLFELGRLVEQPKGPA